jgi:small-conductance mechanosensitive channel
LSGPANNIEIFGIRLLGVDALNARKLLFTTLFFVILYLISKALRAVSHLAVGRAGKRAAFWSRQGISLIASLLGILGFVSIWLDDPARLATGLGLVGAGLAFALQKVITSFAGYFVILRGKTFNVGDRITMGGVRGDVIALNFMQTVIMEMGEPPSVQDSDPGMWVQSRQYSGRIVTVTNSKICDEPVYNYHARLSIYLGGDALADLLQRRPQRRRDDSVGGGRMGNHQNRGDRFPDVEDSRREVFDQTGRDPAPGIYAAH